MSADSYKLYCWLGIVASSVALLVGCVASAQGYRGEPPNRVQKGLASYYGPGFHGEETASGEIFNQYAMVAAHRTLPLGTVVRVVNLNNRRHVVLRVIDRGPYGRNFRRGTIIDVSLGAARRLGFIKEGIVPVRIEVIEFPRRDDDADS